VFVARVVLSRVEASALQHLDTEGVRGPTPLLRLQSDERLVALTRRGNQAAYEALVSRYQSRLLAFCRHMLGSREDAEDVLQEVFAAAFNAMLADERALNVRPWLYRIARNRSLNHLRRTQAIGVDSMDVHLSEHGATTADKVHKREEFRQLMEDVQGLPETQRTALLLREIDALSYEQIAEAMETTVPSIKSLLVRARVSLAEAAEARLLTCEEVRVELGEVAEGLRRTTAPVRRHVRQCERCALFRKQLKNTNKALAAVLPVGPLLLLKKLLLANLGTTASAGGTAAAAAGAGAAAGAAGGGAVSASMSIVASKAAATLAAAAIVTVGTVEVDQVRHRQTPAANASKPEPAVAPAAAAAGTAAPVVVASQPQPVAPAATAKAVTAPAVKDEPATTPKPAAGAGDDKKARDGRAGADDAKPAADTTKPAAPDNGGTPAPAALDPARVTGGAAAAPTATPAVTATVRQPVTPAPTPSTATTTTPAPSAPADTTGGTTAAPAQPTPPPATRPHTTPPPPEPPVTAAQSTTPEPGSTAETGGTAAPPATGESSGTGGEPHPPATP
jgi:RNA polymerase sigma factor (sigma-70 family)